MSNKNFFKTDFGTALIITILWKILMLVIGYLIDRSVNGAVSIIHHTAGWDSGWYMTVINDHYLTNAASAAFYPLFPLLVGIVHYLSLNTIDILTAGQIINTISAWFLISALIILGRELLDDKKKFWLVALVLSMPAAFFLHIFYSEALFMALGLWAYIFALRRNWLATGILLTILTASRLPAILLVGLCGLEFMRAYNWNIKRILNKNLYYFLLAPLGFIAYGTYLLIVRGDFIAMFSAYHATNDWTYQIFDINFLKTITKASYQIFRALLGLRNFDNDVIFNHLLPLASIAFLAAGSVYLIFKQKGKYIPLGIYGLISIIMFTLNSNVVSAHRYILPCLTVYVALAIFIKGKYQQFYLTGICLAGVIIQFWIFYQFISKIFVG